MTAFGNLLITVRTDSLARRLIAPEKRAHARFRTGDSIRVYRQRAAPHRMEVWPAGPDIQITGRELLWLWTIGGVLLVGYWPQRNRRINRDGHAPREAPDGRT